jgi:hypothetical protein
MKNEHYAQRVKVVYQAADKKESAKQEREMLPIGFDSSIAFHLLTIVIRTSSANRILRQWPRITIN